MKNKRVCVIGNLQADLILATLEGFPAWGSELLANKLDRRVGGIGNLVFSLLSLGFPVSVIANIGDDEFGQGILQRLETAGAEVGGVEVTQGQPTGLTVGLTRQDGERAFITYLGHLEHLKADYILKHRHLWQKSKYLIIAGYFLLPGLGFEGTRAVMQEAKKDQKVILFDTGWDVGGWPPQAVKEVLRLLDRVDLFLPSLNEAQRLTGKSQPEECLELLFEHCPRLVIIKLGPRGSIAKMGEEVFYQPAFDVVPLDTTGAGDCFNAGVIYGLSQGWAVPRTLRFANATSALAISRLGEDRYPTQEDVERYLRTQRAEGAFQ